MNKVGTGKKRIWRIYSLIFWKWYYTPTYHRIIKLLFYRATSIEVTHQRIPVLMRSHKQFFKFVSAKTWTDYCIVPRPLFNTITTIQIKIISNLIVWLDLLVNTKILQHNSLDRYWKYSFSLFIIHIEMHIYLTINTPNINTNWVCDCVVLFIIKHNNKHRKKILLMSIDCDQSF